MLSKEKALEAARTLLSDARAVEATRLNRIHEALKPTPPAPALPPEPPLPVPVAAPPTPPSPPVPPVRPLPPLPPAPAPKSAQVVDDDEVGAAGRDLHRAVDHCLQARSAAAIELHTRHGGGQASV